LSDLGRREEALEVIEEAVVLRRDLTAAQPAVFLPDLAHLVISLSSGLSGLGRREDALEAIREAVELLRRLAVDHPVAFNPDLAISFFFCFLIDGRSDAF